VSGHLVLGSRRSNHSGERKFVGLALGTTNSEGLDSTGRVKCIGTASPSKERLNFVLPVDESL
jgi:hypothetical protein